MARIIRPQDRQLEQLTPEQILEPTAPGEVIKRQVLTTEAGAHVQINQISPGYVIHPQQGADGSCVVIPNVAFAQLTAGQQAV